MKSGVSGNLLRLRAALAAACRAAGRDPAAVTLVAIGKGFAADALACAAEAGQSDFGESYLQEAVPKIESLRARGLTWHFVGPVQSNKTAGIAAHFDWVHGVDRVKIAQRLSVQRAADAAPLNVCVQINISGEASKAGVAPPDAAALCRAVAALPRLRLRGLMAIPAPAAPDPLAPYRRLHRLYDALRATGIELDTLSAGMSGDFAAAIAEGATMVRIGTAIFGERAT